MSIKLPQKLMLLGSGELGKEFAIAAQRLGNYVIAVDRYANAPAMQVADAYEVISMLSADDLEAVVTKYQPDMIIPEIEAIRTEKLLEFEQRGITVIPTAVILASEKSDSIAFGGVADALSEKDVDIRLFGKPNAHPYRRMGVALAKGVNVQEAREKATKAANKITII